MSYLGMSKFNVLDEDISPADPNDLDRYQLTVLHKYVLRPEFDANVMRTLINNGNLENRTPSGKTALHLAVINRAKQKVETLIENGADVNAKDNSGNSALHFIALAELNFHFDHVNCTEGSRFLKPAIFNFDDTYLILETLLNKDVHVDAINEDGDTPLMWASRGRHLNIVKKLLVSGASVDLKNRWSETPLHFATMNREGDRMAKKRYDENYLEIVSELVRNKACINSGDMYNITPLGRILHSKYENKEKFAQEFIKIATLWNCEKKFEFYVVKKLIRLGDNQDQLDIKKYADDCYEEFLAMKEEILSGKHNLHKFALGEMTEEELRAPAIKHAVLKILAEGRFRKYEDLILDRCGRQYLRRKARNLTISVSEMNRDIYLNSDIVHNISSYLNNRDILQLLAACPGLFD